MNKLLVIMTTVSVVLGAGQAAAGGDPERGKEKTAACAACHGEDGNSVNPTFPSIAGQYESYLLHALREYKSGARTNPIMGGQVAGLNDQDLQDLAAYYASLPGELRTKK
jgi:cytochrome c553